MKTVGGLLNIMKQRKFKVYYAVDGVYSGSFETVGDDIFQALNREKDCGGVCEGWEVVGITELGFVKKIEKLTKFLPKSA